MNDLVNEYSLKNPTPSQKQADKASENIEAFSFSQEELLAAQNYNANLTKIDPLYSDLKPLSLFLVRVFVNEPTVSENGILIANKQMIPVPTQNGQATMREVESPYPYSNRAIVIATPPISTLLQIGDVVQLNNNPIRAQAHGQGNNATISIPAAYVHPSKGDLKIPTDMSDRHYGYLLIPLNEVLIKL